MELPEELSARLVRHARAAGVTLNTVFQVAWGVLLGRMTGQDDVVFETPQSIRPPDLPGAEAMVGLLINTVLVRIRLVPGERLGDLIARVQREQAALIGHGHLCLRSVRALTGIDGPLADAVLSFDSASGAAGLPGGESLRPGPITVRESTHYAFALNVTPGKRIRLTFGHRADAFDESAAARWTTGFVRLLTAIVDAPATPTARVDVLAPAEKKALLAAFSGRDLPDRSWKSIRAAFEDQVRRTPDATAVVQGDEELSYRELDERATRLAAAAGPAWCRTGAVRGLRPAALAGRGRHGARRSSRPARPTCRSTRTTRPSGPPPCWRRTRPVLLVTTPGVDVRRRADAESR